MSTPFDRFMQKIKERPLEYEKFIGVAKQTGLFTQREISKFPKVKFPKLKITLKKTEESPFNNRVNKYFRKQQRKAQSLHNSQIKSPRRNQTQNQEDEKQNSKLKVSSFGEEASKILKYQTQNNLTKQNTFNQDKQSSQFQSPYSKKSTIVNSSKYKQESVRQLNYLYNKNQEKFICNRDKLLEVFNQCKDENDLITKKL